MIIVKLLYSSLFKTENYLCYFLFKFFLYYNYNGELNHKKLKENQE